MTGERRTGGGAAGDDGAHRVADADEIGEGERLIVDVRGTEVCVFNVDGEYYALANYCIHQGGPLCEGRVSGALTAEMADDGWVLGYEREGRVVSCPWHGWEFDVSSGEHLADSRYRVPTYDVEVREGGVYVTL